MMVFGLRVVSGGREEDKEREGGKVCEEVEGSAFVEVVEDGTVWSGWSALDIDEFVGVTVT